MTASCRTLVAVVTCVLLIFLFFQFPSVPAAVGIGGWSSSTLYPTPVAEETCSTYNGFAYCMGGFTPSDSINAVYFALIDNSGFGSWSATASYPLSVVHSRCSTWNGYIYCVGGYVKDTGLTDAVYFATVGGSGVGAWISTSAYPTQVDFGSCPIYAGYIYCVGGSIGLVGNAPTNAVYFGKVDSSGISAWTQTTSYPVAITKLYCSIFNSFIYCVGGIDSSGPTNAVYFAKVGSSGVDAWGSTKAYPVQVNRHSCVTSGGFIYCVAGYISANPSTSVYFATVGSSGVGTWSQTTSYPIAVYSQDCVANNGYIYCVGGHSSRDPSTGYTDATYYAQSGGVSSTTSSSTVSVSTSSTTTFSSSSTTTSTVPKLSVALNSPANGASVATGTTVTLKVTVKGNGLVVQGATVKMFVDGTQVCSTISNSSGVASCSFKATKASHTYSWYATATKTGFAKGTSATRTFHTN